MAAKYKRYLQKEIVSGKVELPEKLQFLSKANYFAIAEQRVQGVRDWYVEIQVSSLKTLLDTKKKLNAARLSNRNLSAENLLLQNEAISLKARLAEATVTNSRLKESIKEAGKGEASKARGLQKEVSSLEKEVSTLEKELASRTDELIALKNELEPLRRANDQLRKNMEEDRRPERFVKSPKNIFTSIEESGITPVGLPLQGGLAGTTKS